MTARRRLAMWWALNAVLLIALVVTSAMAIRAVSSASRAAAVSDRPTAQSTADVAKTIAVKLLSYQPDTVEHDLESAAELTTGDFHDYYLRFTRETVIPAAQQQRITTTADIPAIGVESLSATTASVIAFVDQTTTVGTKEPAESKSAIRMKLTMLNGQWRVSGLDPI